ncbi:MAG: hypothetical protein HXK09_09215 [Actinomyces bouchesdurhonensis]|uniref:Uncharacterized protein n=1 Tax=Actinomyces bouchesdurhonensis TaxID=1852361 RepID=A0A929RSC1_9ACTO|nr:hypothetical protein [Actinomyces bouchesdurhonensis]
MTPGFSLRRIFNSRRYFYALIAADPNQAVTHTVNYWVSKGAWGETNGMREQLAQHGWVGTEIADGLDTMRGLLSTVADPIARSDLFPQSASQPAAPTRLQTSRILVAARSWSAEGRVASEVWCFDTRVSQRNTPTTKEDVGHYLQDLAVTLQLDELLLAQPELLFEGDLPTDHLFAGRNVIAMRQAATKESRRGH